VSDPSQRACQSRIERTERRRVGHGFVKFDAFFARPPDAPQRCKPDKKPNPGIANCRPWTMEGATIPGSSV
jgi:hypothetical protein